MQCARREFLFATVPAALLLVAASASALERSKDGWFHTGDGVRVKKVVFVTVRAYAISHYMRTLPATKSKQAVIDLDADKQLAYRMLRGIGADKMKKMLRDAFADNGYTDAAAIESFVGAFHADLKEGDNTNILYDSARKATTITTASGTATIAGIPFMRATWSLWFGKIDQPSLGDELISKI